MPDADETARALARKLDEARRSGVPLSPAVATGGVVDGAIALHVQDHLVALRGGAIGGWKVGAKSPAGAIQGAPLPAAGVLASPATWPGFASIGGIELEIAFRFERAFVPEHAPYGDDEVLDAIGSMCATIELVASRWSGWPQVAPELQLADLQNHGALIVGAARQYERAFRFDAVATRIDLGGVALARPDAHAGTNPAGDPRRLVPWLVNHATARGHRIEPATVITTGSYVGLLRLPATAKRANAIAVTAEVVGLPPVVVTLAS